MKRIILILLVLTSLSISAQNIRFGVKGGLNVSSLNGDNTFDYWSKFKYKTGFHIGGYCRV